MNVRQLILRGLTEADQYAQSIKSNPQFPNVPSPVAAVVNRLAENDFFDFTVVIPFRFQTTEGPAMAASIFPSDDNGNGVAYEDLVIPFSIQDTGKGHSCEIVSGSEAAVAADKAFLIPTFKVITIDSQTTLDSKRPGAENSK